MRDNSSLAMQNGGQKKTGNGISGLPALWRQTLQRQVSWLADRRFGPAFPVSQWQLVGSKLPAYSCGGSHGSGSPTWIDPTVFPFNPLGFLALEGTVTIDYTNGCIFPSSKSPNF